MNKQNIPNDVKEKVKEIVANFNETEIKEPELFFEVSFRTSFAYLKRKDYGEAMPQGRMTYFGSMKDWEFAIYKYSKEKYDPDDWFFPGTGLLNGTIRGGLLACMEAYPASGMGQMMESGFAKTILRNLFNAFGDEKPDSVYEADNLTGLIQQKKKIGRNVPCPCGSGKKYKKCHGKKGV